MSNKTVKISEVACSSEYYGVVKFLCDVLLYGVPLVFPYSYGGA